MNIPAEHPPIASGRILCTRMVLDMVHLAALLCLALMTGNEICVAVFVNPVLRRLPEPSQIPLLRPATRRLGSAMPIWYITSLALTCADWYVRHQDGVQAFNGASVSIGLQIVITLVTVTLMVTINTRLGKLEANDSGWTGAAVRWDRLHAARVVLLLLATAAITWN